MVVRPSACTYYRVVVCAVVAYVEHSMFTSLLTYYAHLQELFAHTMSTVQELVRVFTYHVRLQEVVVAHTMCTIL